MWKPLYQPEPWPQFVKRKDIAPLPLMEQRRKHMEEQMLFENFVTFQVQQQALLNQQSSFGGPNRVFTSTIQLQKAMVEWYANQRVAELKYGPIEEWDVSRVTSFANVVGGENPFYDFLANQRSCEASSDGCQAGWLRKE